MKIKENRKKRDKYLNIAREVKKPWNMKVTVIPTVLGALGTIQKRLVKGLEGGNWRVSKDHPNYRIIKVGQNTEKNPGDPRRLLSVSIREI